MVDKNLVPSPSSSMPNNHVEVDGINGIATFQQNRSPASSFKNTNPNGLVRVIVRFLDSSNSAYDVSSKSLGRTLFLQVCESISVQLFESDFFCLQWWSNGSMYWLDLDKPICKQLSLPGKNIAMYFAVKFYTVEPLKLEDELSRYLFALQIKKDLAEGYLICSPSVSAMLASFIVQAECGDFNNEEYSNHLYISKIKLIPQQDEEFEIKVMENHKLLVGMPPAQADLQLLELAKDQEMYGIKLSPCKDHECVPLNLAATHHGILIFQNHTKVNTFDWSKIRKLSFKRKHFFIKLHQEEFFGDVLEFVFQHRNECKNFWKKCIEQHSFFKCIDIKRKSRQKLRIFSRGSSFRYAGRTQQQLSELVKENKSRKQKSFQRSSSMKLNSVREDDNPGYSSDANDPKELQTDSISYTASIKQMHKSCDTLDQDSGLNYYSLHSILSFADQSSSILNGKSNEYSLHATNKRVSSQMTRSYKYNLTGACKAPTQRQFYISIRFNGCAKFKQKYIKVGSLPSCSSFSANDDTKSDPFLDYLRDLIVMKHYLCTLTAKVMAQRSHWDCDLAPLASLILRVNIDEHFNREFKSSNFDMQFESHCQRTIIVAKYKDTETPVFNMTQAIMSTNLGAFQLF